MFFDKEKNSSATPGQALNPQNSVAGDGIPSFLASELGKYDNSIKQEQKSSYAFYKPDPYPKELVSVLKSMLQRLFPDTRRAFLLEAKQNNKKGYLLIVDIDSKFLKIINIYLDSETKRVRNDVPIECVLYSKSSASLTEGVEPFYFREITQEEELKTEIAKKSTPAFDIKDEPLAGVSDIKAEKLFEKPAPAAAKKEEKVLGGTEVHTNQTLKRTLSGVSNTKPATKVKPTTKAELFGLLNEYGARKTGTVSTVAMAAVREFEFFIPFVSELEKGSGKLVSSLPIDDKLRFKTVVNPQTEKRAVPLFTEEESATDFAKKDNCLIIRIKYKDFASSRAFEITGHDGIVINPEAEGIFMLSTHPLLG